MQVKTRYCLLLAQNLWKSSLWWTGLLKLHYELQHYERTPEHLLLFTMRFQKRGGQPIKAGLWIRVRKIDDLVELILIRGHAEPL
jgi:hypothetical protein